MISVVKLLFKAHKQLRKDFPENIFYNQNVNAAFSDYSIYISLIISEDINVPNLAG